MTYVPAVRAALARTGDPARAAQQQAYMKSELPFVGLGAPALRTLLRPLLAEHRFADRDRWEAAVLELWEDAEHREEWYAAIALLRHRPYRQWLYPIPTIVAVVGWVYVYVSATWLSIALSLGWIVIGCIAFLIYAKAESTWPFGPKEIKETFLEEQPAAIKSSG